MAIDSNRFPLQNAIKKILDDPNSRPALPVLEDGSSVGDDNFGEADRYDSGELSDIALNNGNLVVEVHESKDSLWYRLGQVDEKTITWGNDGKSTKYDSGAAPSVAITNNGLVVEVHRTGGLVNNLWYRLGQVEGNTITWRNDGKSIKYDNGEQPSVAINNNGLVVEAHITGGGNNNLWYRLGQVEGNTIAWRNDNKSIKYDNGQRPSLGITDDGLVVEVHMSGGPRDSLWYRLGKVEGNIINWRNNDKSIEYDIAVNPSVAITNDGLVVTVHSDSKVTLPTSPPSPSVLSYRLGQVEGDTIAWRNDDKSINYGNGGLPRVACNGHLAVETHTEGKDNLLCSVLTLPAFRSNWINLHGENSYCYCACNSATNDKQRHASNHTMKIEPGAPYFYAVLTKNDDSADFSTGAILTIQGPDGTNYDRDIQEENQLVIMSGSSVRCLIVKDPKPGDWKMTMTVPEGVGFHCECSTVPTTDVYDTVTNAQNSLQKRFLSVPAPIDFRGAAAVFDIFAVEGVAAAALVPWLALFAVAVVGVGYILANNGEKKELPTDQKLQKGKNILKATKNAGISKVKAGGKWLLDMSSTNSRTKKKEGKPMALFTWNFQGANWNDIANSPWYKTKDWFIGYSQREGNIPYNFVVACLQECGTPPSTATLVRDNIDNNPGLRSYLWPLDDRSGIILSILFYEWDDQGHRVNLAVVSTIGVETVKYIGGVLRPLIGVQFLDSYFFSIHAASGSNQGGDAWSLLNQVNNQVNSSWWVAGDYNQEPDLLTQRLQSNNVNATVCPPNAVTRPASNRKLDYAVRDANANVIVGEVPSFGDGYSDHLPVVYRL